MPLDTQHRMGTVTEFKPDSKTGVITQNPESTESGSGLTTHGTVVYGTPFVMTGIVKQTADGTAYVNFFSKDCPHKLLILDAWVYTRTYRTGGTPNHTIKLEHGDGAASESFNDITDTVDLDDATTDAPTRFGTLSDAYTTIASNKSLRATAVVGGTTTAGTALHDVHVLAVRIK